MSGESVREYGAHDIEHCQLPAENKSVGYSNYFCGFSVYTIPANLRVGWYANLFGAQTLHVLRKKWRAVLDFAKEKKKKQVKQLD